MSIRSNRNCFDWIFVLTWEKNTLVFVVAATAVLHCCWLLEYHHHKVWVEWNSIDGSATFTWANDNKMVKKNKQLSTVCAECFAAIDSHQMILLCFWWHIFYMLTHRRQSIKYYDDLWSAIIYCCLFVYCWVILSIQSVIVTDQLTLCMYEYSIYSISAISLVARNMYKHNQLMMMVITVETDKPDSFHFIFFGFSVGAENSIIHEKIFCTPFFSLSIAYSKEWTNTFDC